MRPTELRIDAGDGGAPVSALSIRPRAARCALALAHGAGAGMRHPFMETLADALAERRVATFRYQFPYMEARDRDGSRRPPNPRRVLVATIRSALRTAAEVFDDLPLLAGGKSMGGRMTSLAAAEAPLEKVRALVFVGFPLHAPGKPVGDRADPLGEVSLPMLFVQGDRDSMGSPEELHALCADLEARGRAVRLHVVAGGDHSFGVLKRSGRSAAEVYDELADTIEDFAASVPGE